MSEPKYIKVPCKIRAFYKFLERNCVSHILCQWDSNHFNTYNQLISFYFSHGNLESFSANIEELRHF